MNTKADLKAAREAIGGKKFSDAVKACKRVLLWEGENYNAWVFLGVAYTGLEDDQEAEEAYKRAIEINTDSMLGWQGLINFYEKRQKYTELSTTLQDIIPRVVTSGDGAKLAEYLKKLATIYKTSQPEKHLETLKYFLPGSAYYDLIKDQADLPPQLDIWALIIEKLEAEQKQKIEAEVASRRFRMNVGTPAQILSEVEAEVFGVSKLGIMYEKVLALIPGSEPKEIEAWKLKLLQFNVKRITGVRDKSELYEQIIGLAKELISVNDPLPLELLIELANVDKPEKYDWDLLENLIARFPDSGLAKLGSGYKLSKQGDIDQAFDLFSEGLEAKPYSLFGYQCLSWIYYDSKEFETGLEYATKGKDLVGKIRSEWGVSLNNVSLSMELYMAHFYRLIDRKYHMDATALYKSILQRYPDQTSALEGLGFILLDEKRLDEAFGHFEKVHALDPTNHTALAEMGWIYCEKQNYDEAIRFITTALEVANKDIPDYYYRLGRVYWTMEDAVSSFKYFMQAVKLDPFFSQGFTYLGHHYREIKADHPRAKKCYQKAYVLNPLDTDAALHLSNYHIADGEQEDAEAIFIQISEASPKTGWAWRRMGYVKLNEKSYNESITCFQKALRADTSDVSCWEGLAEAYSRAGRFVAALKAFGRAIQLNPQSIHANNERASVQQKIGSLDEAIAGFKHTLTLAEEQGKPNYLPALCGLAETYLEHAKEDFGLGFFGRAADGCSRVIENCLIGLCQDISVVMLWKLVGDACCFFRQIPSYIHLCDYASLQKVMLLVSNPHQALQFEPDTASHWIHEFLGLEDVQDLALPPKAALDVVLSCATFAYKQAIVVCKNHPAASPAFWHDLAMVYYYLNLNNNDESSVAIQCVKVALTMERAQYIYWNTLGVIAMAADLPKLAQHALIKAMEYNNRSAIPWTNYGFLCLSLKDYELANQAFDMAHSLDPEWISAWVGQAYVTGLWGNDASAIFEHAFESSSGSALDASYGYAETTYQKASNEYLITPVFALEKLTEQRVHDALSFNLLGLLLEKLGQHHRAAQSFASALLAVEAQLEEESVTPEEGQSRLDKIHANLSRCLVATGDFEGGVASYENHQTHTVYSQLNAGIAHYFLDQLPESLALFESALNETQDDITLRQDVVVLLAKVLWALGGEEQRAVAKEQLFSSISDNSTYLPAIFSLCVMGVMEEDETLTSAALQELLKIPSDIAYTMDKEQSSAWLLSKVFEIQGDAVHASRSLVRCINKTPWLAKAWTRLSKHMISSDQHDEETVERITSASLRVSARQHDANVQSEAYQMAALAQSNHQTARKHAQRAVVTAPWRLNAWQALTI
ncbi:Superkiller protein 3 [Rhizopus stolonifer]|uniref:Superkiller protein 3 n=1 Tax=Rhizopus stolonifer TaxID=4846 RepID=A0A367KM97_RHIST|nr:Superkiller protein 3 [Rhizopus stolonifer]